MDPGRCGGARRRAALAALLPFAFACAGPLVAFDGGYRHEELGYRFRDPGPPWQRIDLEGAAVAYRAASLGTMSLRTTCGRPLAEPAIMARHLRIGIDEHEMLGSGPVEVDGRAAWAQHLAVETGAGGRVEIKTVTAIAGDCTYDWLLATRELEATVEGAFDAWWQGFRLPGDAPGGEA